MRADRLFLIGALGIVGLPSTAEEIDCPSISASTHYHSSSTASASESGGHCTVSVDNADADSAGFTPQTLWCLSRGFNSGQMDVLIQSGQIDNVVLGQIVALLAVPSIPPGDGVGPSPDGFPWPQSTLDCDSFFNDLSNAGDGALNSGVFSQLDDGFGSFGDAVTNCLFSGSASFPITTCNLTSSTVQMGFSTGFGDHIVAVPR